MNLSKIQGNSLKEFAKFTASDKRASVVIEVHFKKLYPYAFLDSLEQRIAGKVQNVVRSNSTLSLTCDVRASDLYEITDMDIVSSVSRKREP